MILELIMNFFLIFNLETNQTLDITYNIDKFISDEMPVLFISHGSPRNAIRESNYSKSLENTPNLIGKDPKAILIISAHWLARDTYISCNQEYETIYDFYGFEDELYNIEYNAKGDVDLANYITQLVDGKCTQRGLDHGAWTVLTRMYPNVDIPVIEMSIDYTLSNQEMFELGEKLKPLREIGVLVIGSGSMTHNLRDRSFNINSNIENWAKEFDDSVADKLENKEFDQLIEFNSLPNAKRSHPTPDHYWPLIYTIGLIYNEDETSFPYTGFEYGTLSMRNVLFK